MKVNRIIKADSRDLRDYVDDGKASLVVTSPPYNVGKEYENMLDLEEYLSMLDAVWNECWRFLKTGGRLLINVADTRRKPYVPLHAHIAVRLINKGWFMRGMIVWDKGSSAQARTSWGSWMSPSNPYLVDIAEYIIVFSKTNERIRGHAEPDITRNEFLRYKDNIWRMGAESAKRIGHPAPFPLELPWRAIKFYTYPEDLVVDPFNGSGTTCLAAKLLGRKYLGFDVVQKYVTLANNRVNRVKVTETL